MCVSCGLVIDIMLPSMLDCRRYLFSYCMLLLVTNTYLVYIFIYYWYILVHIIALHRNRLLDFVRIFMKK